MCTAELTRSARHVPDYPQGCAVDGDPAANTATAAAQIAAAAAAGARIIVFPELYLTGYVCRALWWPL